MLVAMGFGAGYLDCGSDTTLLGDEIGFGGESAVAMKGFEVVVEAGRGILSVNPKRGEGGAKTLFCGWT